MKILFLLLALFFLVQKAKADDSSFLLSAGESKLFKVKSADQTTIEDTSIASFNAISDTEILISGKSAGKTKISYPFSELTTATKIDNFDGTSFGTTEQYVFRF